VGYAQKGVSAVELEGDPICDSRVWFSAKPLLDSE